MWRKESRNATSHWSLFPTCRPGGMGAESRAGESTTLSSDGRGARAEAGDRALDAAGRANADCDPKAPDAGGASHARRENAGGCSEGSDADTAGTHGYGKTPEGPGDAA